MSLDLTKYKLIPLSGDGRTGIFGRAFLLGTSDDLATATTLGYLDNLVNLKVPLKNRALQNDDFILLNYNLDTESATPAWVSCSVGYDVGLDSYKLTAINLSGSTGSVTSVFTRSGDVVAAAGDYKASQINFLPAGSISATTVQTAIEELDTKKLTTGLPNESIWIGDGTDNAVAHTVSGDVLMSSTGVTIINNNVITLDKLSLGVQPSHVVKFAESITWSGGLDNVAISVPGVLDTDIIIASIASAPTEPAYLVSASVSPDTVAFTLSAANGSNDAIVNYQVLRATV